MWMKCFPALKRAGKRINKTTEEVLEMSLPERNLALELVRATESAAMAAGVAIRKKMEKNHTKYLTVQFTADLMMYPPCGIRNTP